MEINYKFKENTCNENTEKNWDKVSCIHFLKITSTRHLKLNELIKEELIIQYHLKLNESVL